MATSLGIIAQIIWFGFLSLILRATFLAIKQKKGLYGARIVSLVAILVQFIVFVISSISGSNGTRTVRHVLLICSTIHISLVPLALQLFMIENGNILIVAQTGDKDKTILKWIVYSCWIVYV